MLFKSCLKHKCYYIKLINKRKYSKTLTAIDKFENFDPVNIDGAYNYQKKILQKNKDSEIFSMIMPPPNVTGNLHIGHALSFTLQDIIIRSKRMMGLNTVWIPGCDHAGIATQIQVEKYLKKIKGKNWNSNLISRKEFVNICNDWSAKRRENISCQIKSLGLDPNWDLEFFTLDEQHSRVVSRAFIDLYNKKKIFRENRIINWSCQLQSAISDIEVDFKEIKGETNINVPGYKKPIKFGIIYYVKYKCEKGNESEIVVATTRPETIPGDVCLAVNPSDSRYSYFIGQRVQNPITGELMPVIADSEVEPGFGTGVIKVTPGHSLTDFRIAQRHKLVIKNIIDNCGNMENVIGLNITGVPRFLARDIILDFLIDKNLLQKCQRDHTMKLPVCSRSGDIVEYVIRPQWFYDVSEASDKAIQAIEKKEINIQPWGYTGEFIKFFKSKEPWCVSRQLKWGHNIPAYFYSEQNQAFIGSSQNEILENFPLLDSSKLKQDPDVLDTWFSSSLLPLSLGGWPKSLNKCHPISLLVTGHDIVRLWVCRMMIMSLEMVNQLPFKNILLHGMICDTHGEKMSKSRGNVIDPIQLIGTHLFDKLISSSSNSNLKDFNDLNSGSKNVIVKNIGSDAVRFSLLENYVSGHHIRFSLDKAISARNFMQKMWQSVRFVYHHWAEDEVLNKRCENLKDSWEMITQSKQNSFNHLQKWLLYELASLVSTVNLAQDQYTYHPLCIEVREFWWNSLCSVFIEWCKSAYSFNPDTFFGPQRSGLDELYCIRVFSCSDQGLFERSKACSNQNQLNLELILLSINTCLHLIHPIVPQLSQSLWHSILKEKVENRCLGDENYPSKEMVKVYLSSEFKKSNSVVSKALMIVSEINFWTKSLKLSKTKLNSSDIIFLEKIKSDDENIHEIVSRLSNVRVVPDISSETCFSIKIHDSLQLNINGQLCDIVAFESGLSSKLKQCIAIRNEIEKRLSETGEEENTRKQLTEIKRKIKAYENHRNTFQLNRKKEAKI